MALLLNAGDTVLRSYSYTQPSPLHPSQPQGTGERTANLWSGGNVSIAVGERYKGTNIDLPNNTYTFKAKYSSTNTGSVTIGFYDENNTIHTYNMTQIDGEVSTPYTGIITAIRLYSAAGYTPSASYSAAFTDIMLNSGSTPLPYEPYGYKIPILSGGTTTPVYLGEVQTTRRIKKLVLTGEEDWVSKGNPATFRYENSPIPHTLNNSVCYCSHFKNLPWQQVVITNNSFAVEFTSTPDTINIRCDDYSTVEDFKTFLQQQYANGTPVTIWYVLATPTTGIVNEPLRKIGDYADTVSGITIPTIAGANTFSVGTTVQPSEVTVNYKGWHPVADVHEADNGAWT